MVEFPAWRQHLIVEIRALADVIYQYRVWIDLESPRIHWFDNLEQVIHLLLDDLHLDTQLEQAIGLFKNSAEAEAVAMVTEALVRALDNLPKGARDEVFVSSSYWPDVVFAARHAYGVLTDGQDADDMFEAVAKGWPPKGL